jgi:endonuclease/exonuclease/phosphatase family metal-dependent hydrolase
MAALLRRAAPDVIGTQEGHFTQIREIAEDSGRYRWVGTGRDGGGRGEWCAILYDPAVLTPVEEHHFWLSDTPEVPGSVGAGWGNTVVRMATWARFRTAEGGELAWLNTHLDHRSAEARRRGAVLIAERLAAVDVPLVVSGDFNCEPGTEPYRVLTGAGLVDAWAAAEGRRFRGAGGTRRAAPAGQGTYGGWRAPRGDSGRIDWILTRGPIVVHGAEICEDHDGEHWPSDHVPVRVELGLPAATPGT